VAEIVLACGSVALVDDERYEDLVGYRWRLKHARRGGASVVAAPRRNGKQRHIALHRLVVGAPAGTMVDHIDGNPLDNRRDNLRLANNSLNQANRRKSSRKSSKYKGVCRHRQLGKWQAAICVNGQRRYLGVFDHEEAAAKAYDAAARQAFGEFARPNFEGEW
jgi:hypothetical protein